MMDINDVLVIGGGISGLMCATRLRAERFSVLVLDKGRKAGGRMSTREVAGARWDHGAQFFTVKDSLFQTYVDDWLEAGIIREWFRHSPRDTNKQGYSRYCGIAGMTSVPAYLAEKLAVVQSERVIEIFRNINYWVVRTMRGNTYAARHLVITTPLPQALALLDTTGLNYAGDQLSSLRKVKYERGLAVLAQLSGPSGLPEPGGMHLDDSSVSWVADNQMKGISPDASTLTLHATPEFADKHWDSPDSIRGPLLIEAVNHLIQSDVVSFDCHRWGFTTAVNPWQERCFNNRGLRLTLAGDSFGGPRVEGAALSGLEAADKVLESIRIEITLAQS